MACLRARLARAVQAQWVVRSNAFTLAPVATRVCSRGLQTGRAVTRVPVFARAGCRTVCSTPPCRDEEAEAPADADAGEDGAEGEEVDPRATLEEQTKTDEELASNHLYFELLVHYWCVACTTVCRAGVRCVAAARAA